MRLELADAEAMRIGALLAAHQDAGVRRHAARLSDPDHALLAATVEKWRKYGLALTTNGCGAPWAALRELGLDSDLGELTAYRAHKRHYPPVKLPDGHAPARDKSRRLKRTPVRD